VFASQLSEHRKCSRIFQETFCLQTKVKEEWGEVKEKLKKVLEEESGKI
jgi:hypothetical protein